MLKELIEDTRHRMDQAVIHTGMELAKIRTGRANPELLNAIKVDYYGTPTPINQVSNISVPEPRLITVQPWEKNLLPVIERAIINHNLGLTPSNNGNVIMIPIPTLSEERRRDLTRFMHSQVEDGRIAVRNIRRDAIHHLRALQKDENISEDVIKHHEDDVQKLTDEHIEKLAVIQADKESEIMEV